MSIINDFTKVCAVMAAIECRRSGAPVGAIAKQAGVSVTTIRRWLRLGGLR